MDTKQTDQTAGSAKRNNLSILEGFYRSRTCEVIEAFRPTASASPSLPSTWQLILTEEAIQALKGRLKRWKSG